MAVPSPLFTILLHSTDPDVQAQVRQTFKDASVTVSRDSATFQKELARYPFDAVVMEARNAQERQFAFPHHLDPSRTLVIAGTRTVLKRTVKLMQPVNQSEASSASSHHQGKTRDASLESYLEMKMGDFVKGMRNGSARNLHPILISAVERPLIASALRETHGNQIQAAELLGLNRNTLRKKIADLHIPFKRAKSKSGRTA